MSIPTRLMFGRPSDSPRLSPAGVRCARLRAARGLAGIRWLFAGLGIAQVVIATAFRVLAVYKRATSAGSGSTAEVAWKMIWSTPTFWLVMLVLIYAAIVAASPWLVRVIFDLTTDRLTVEAAARARAMRRSSRTTAIMMAVIAGLAVVASFAADLQFGLTSLAMVLANGSGLLIPFGLFNRRGARIVCARCDYPMSTWRGSPELCPECGSAWKKPWRARLGERRRRPGLTVVGVLMLVLSMVILAVGILKL